MFPNTSKRLWLLAILAPLQLGLAQSPKCDPCVDGPEMFEHKKALEPNVDDAIEATDIGEFPDKNVPYCQLESDTSHELDAPPRNAAALRDMARRHPRSKSTFGPPASHRQGASWDLTNEFWYRETNGDLVLYSNTDDNYMYHWRFRTSGGKVKLTHHGLLECTAE